MNVSDRMPSNDLAKIIFFIVIQLVTCLIFFWGVIPSIVLFISYFLMKRDKNVTILVKSMKFSSFYTVFSIIVGIVIIVFNIFTVTAGYSYEDKQAFLENAILGIFIILGVGISYMLALHYLFYKPIKAYDKWVAERGLFSSSKQKQELSILKTENMKSYSVADELLKWKELKDQGLISEDEFLKMKEKIMGNNT